MAIYQGPVRRWAGPRAGYGWAGVATAITVVTVIGGWRDWHGSALERIQPSWILLLGLLGALAIVYAAWVIGGWRPPVALGLAAAIAGLLVPTWAAWPTLLPGLRALAIGFAPAAVLGACHVGLGWRPLAGGRILTVIDVMVLTAVGVHVLGYNPFADPACARTCLPATPAAGALVSTGLAIGVSAGLSVLAALAGAIAIVRDRRPGAPGIARVGVLVTLGALSLDQAIGARWLHVSTGPLTGSLEARPDFVLEAVAAVVLGLTALSAALSTDRARRAIEALVRGLADPLAVPRAAGPGATLQFAVAGEDRWVTSAGAPAPEPADGQQAVVLSDRAGAALRLIVSTGTDAADVLAAITPATRLALHNARLAAATRASVADVRASQRRIVTASDAERRRIERDLHDGAQQRLVSARLYLSLARNRDNAHADHLERVEAAVGEALEALRRLGHGIFPPALATEGLAAALEDLVRNADVNVTADVASVEGVTGEATVAAYAAVAFALEHAHGEPPATSVSVAATTVDDHLAVAIAGRDGRPIAASEVVDLTDRVGALGGEVTVRNAEDGFHLEVRVPCGS